MKKLITIVLLATSSIAVACEVESVVAERRTNGTLIHISLNQCNSHKFVYAKMYCDDTFKSNEWSKILPGGSASFWPRWYCDSKLTGKFSFD